MSHTHRSVARVSLLIALSYSIHSQHWHNVLGTFTISPAQEAWLLEQQRWSEEHVDSRGSSSPAWRAVGLTLAQLKGLVEGYQQRREEELADQGSTSLPQLGLLEFLKISAVGTPHTDMFVWCVFL